MSDSIQIMCLILILKNTGQKLELGVNIIDIPHLVVTTANSNLRSCVVKLNFQVIGYLPSLTLRSIFKRKNLICPARRNGGNQTTLRKCDSWQGSITSAVVCCTTTGLFLSMVNNKLWSRWYLVVKPKLRLKTPCTYTHVYIYIYILTLLYNK